VQVVGGVRTDEDPCGEKGEHRERGPAIHSVTSMSG
jgi:hypothetical protein